jgi:hypothetical protein
VTGLARCRALDRAQGGCVLGSMTRYSGSLPNPQLPGSGKRGQATADNADASTVHLRPAFAAPSV